ncbi:MAG: mannosyltransferase family protein [Candidatus Curtissbacteria bacterium]|nr:mannosyltransferase family protein [Candidatus Curtissbacteria bacterium]
MILKIFIFWRISLFVLTYLGSVIFPKVANGGIGAIGQGKTFDFLSSWAQWDGGHFINIARLGYFNPQEYAFFPLLPNLIRFVTIFTFGNLVLAGLIISNVSFLAFLIIFHKLVNKKFGSQIANISVFTFLTFPSAFFGVAVYSESIFLLLAVLALYFLESKRFLYAALCASLAGATRVVGVFLIIPFTISLLSLRGALRLRSGRQSNLEQIASLTTFARNDIVKALLIPLSVSGLFLYSLYLYLKFGDPFYFSTVESVWHRSFVNPFSTIYSYLTINVFAKPFNDYLDIAATLGFLVILALGFRKIPKSWWFYSLLVILVPASTGTLTSMPRYVLSAFPVFILLGIYLKDRQILRMITWGIFLVLQVALAIMFVNGFWTA